jgi:hypothetical protein
MNSDSLYIESGLMVKPFHSNPSFFGEVLMFHSFFVRFSRLMFLGVLMGFFIGFQGDLQAQKIKASVSMILERLPLDKQEMMKNFADDLERYLWETDWVDQGGDEELPLSIQIFLNDASVTYEYRFSGTFLVSNTSDLQYSDKYWRFPYLKENKLTHSDTYDPLTGFIDFYIYLILGAEFDARGELAGQPFYEKAQAIGDQAMFNAQYVLGWRERNEMMDRLMSDEFKQFRIMKDRYYLGLSYQTETY